MSEKKEVLFDDDLSSRIKSYMAKNLYLDLTSYGADKFSDYIISLGYRKSSPRVVSVEEIETTIYASLIASDVIDHEINDAAQSIHRLIYGGKE